METISNFSENKRIDGSTSSLLPIRALLYSALGILSVLYYIKFGATLVTQYYFNGIAIPNLHLAIIALLVVLTLTAIGCSIHVRILGGFERSDLEKEIGKEISRLSSIYSAVGSRVAEVESQIFDNHAILSQSGAEALRTLKKISRALDKRISLTSNLANSGSLPELFRAIDILRRKLNTSESATTSLIDIDPIPAIEVHKIEAVVKSLSAEIEIAGANSLAA